MEMELHDEIYHVQPGGTLPSGYKHRGSFKRRASVSLLPLETMLSLEEQEHGKESTVSVQPSALKQRIQQVKQWETDTQDAAALEYLRSLEAKLQAIPARAPKVVSASRTRHSIASMQRQLASIIGCEEKAEAQHTTALSKEDEIIRQATERKKTYEFAHKAYMEDLAHNKARAVEAISKMQTQLEDSPDGKLFPPAPIKEPACVELSKDSMGLISYVESCCSQKAYGLPPELVAILKRGMLEYLATTSATSESSGLSGQGAGGGSADGLFKTVPSSSIQASPAKAPRTTAPLE